MFADIYLIVIGQKQKKDQKFTKSKEKKGKSKQRQKYQTFFEAKINKEETNTTGKRPREERGKQ